MAKKKILIVCSNSIERRSDKQSMLLKDKYEVLVLRWNRECDEPKIQKKDGFTIEYFRLKALYDNFTLIPFLFVWNVYLFFSLLFRKFDIVQSTNLDNLFPVLFVAKLKGKKLVHDVIDVYGDSLNEHIPLFIRKTLTLLERFMVVFLDKLIMVDDCRADQLGLTKNMRKKLTILYNLPVVKQKPKKRKLGKKSKLSVLYIGLLANNRGLPYMVETFSEMKKVNFILGGIGADEKLQKIINKNSKKITWLGKVQYHDVLKYTAKADCLIALYDPKVPNHVYASPNKMFEALAFGKPIITNKGTHFGNQVKKYNIGLLVNYGDIKNLKEKVYKLRNNPRLLKKLSDNSVKTYENKYNWQIQKKKLLSLYKNL